MDLNQDIWLHAISSYKDHLYKGDRLYKDQVLNLLEFKDQKMEIVSII